MIINSQCVLLLMCLSFHIRQVISSYCPNNHKTIYILDESQMFYNKAGCEPCRNNAETVWPYEYANTLKQSAGTINDFEFSFCSSCRRGMESVKANDCACMRPGQIRNNSYVVSSENSYVYPPGYTDWEDHRIPWNGMIHYVKSECVGCADNQYEFMPKTYTSFIDYNFQLLEYDWSFPKDGICKECPQGLTSKSGDFRCHCAYPTHSIAFSIVNTVNTIDNVRDFITTFQNELIVENGIDKQYYMDEITGNHYITGICKDYESLVPEYGCFQYAQDGIYKGRCVRDGMCNICGCTCAGECVRLPDLTNQWLQSIFKCNYNCEAPKYWATGGCYECPNYEKGAVTTGEMVRIEDCSCGWGQYKDSGICIMCTYNTFSTAVQAVSSTTCVNCEAGKFSDQGSNSCSLCPLGLYGPGDGLGCANCPEGLFGVVMGATTCVECGACPDSQYRRNCTSENVGYCEDCGACDDPTNFVRVGCMNNAGNNERHGECQRRDLLVQAPVCPTPTKFLKITEDGLEEVSANKEQVGLGGYTFRQVFGYEAREAPFQCRRLCTGEPRTDVPVNESDVVAGRRDQGTCAGPFACNIPACSMDRTLVDAAISTERRVPKSCPVSLEGIDPYSDSGKLVRRESCQTCQRCGDPNENGNNLPDFGRGCAGECTRLVCPVDTIFDWTDGFHQYDANAANAPLITRCKQCAELRDYRLCPVDPTDSSSLSNNFAASDVSGNRLLLRFDGCREKIGIEDFNIGYGTCKSCAVDEFECVYDQSTNMYPGKCSGELVEGGRRPCARCLFRGGPAIVTVAKGVYYDEYRQQQPLFCQVSCVQGWTGVQEESLITPAICSKRCDVSELNAKECADSEFVLECSVPHDRRCVPRFPTLRVGDTRRSIAMMPVYTNMIETVPADGQTVLASTFFANFENAFINLQADSDNLHQCVWNAVDVRDNDKTPGGVSYTFWPPAMSYAFPLTAMGSKWCHWSLGKAEGELLAWTDDAFLRKPDVNYPLLPLQNIVGSGGDPRRLLMNTSARVMRYCESLSTGGLCTGGYSGAGEQGIARQQALGRPVNGNAYVGDLYLGLEMNLARNATMLWMLPDRVLDPRAAWVPGFTLSYFVREATHVSQYPNGRDSSVDFSVSTLAMQGVSQTEQTVSVADVTLSSIMLPIDVEDVGDSFETRLWSSQTPVLVCNSDEIGDETNTSVYGMASFRESLYLHDTSLSILEETLRTLFPALAVADADPEAAGSIPAVHLRYRKQETSISQSPGEPSCMRLSRTGTTCVAYYSTGSRIYCVHANMSVGNFVEFSVDSDGNQHNITDFVVVEVDGQDALIVRKPSTQKVFWSVVSDFLQDQPTEVCEDNVALFLKEINTSKQFYIPEKKLLIQQAVTENIFFDHRGDTCAWYKEKHYAWNTRADEFCYNLNSDLSLNKRWRIWDESGKLKGALGAAEICCECRQYLRDNVNPSDSQPISQSLISFIPSDPPLMEHFHVRNLRVGVILQLATDGTSLFMVKRLDDENRLTLEVAALNETGIVTPLEWESSDAIDVGDWQSEHVTLEVSPQRDVLVVLRAPSGGVVVLLRRESDSEWTYRTYSSEATPGDSVFWQLEQRTQPSAAWLGLEGGDSVAVVLGRNGKTCIFRSHASLDVSVTVTCESSILDNVLFERVLHGYITQHIATAEFDLVATVHAIEINRSDCADPASYQAVYHAVTDGDDFRYRRGPLYTMDGTAHRLESFVIESLEKFPTEVYSHDGSLVSTDDSGLMLTLTEPDEMGYMLFIQCHCAEVSASAYLKIADKVDLIDLTKVCASVAEHVDSIEVKIRVSPDFMVDAMTPTHQKWHTVCTVEESGIEIHSKACQARARRGISEDTPAVDIEYLAPEWQQVYHGLSTPTVQNSTGIALQFLRHGYTERHDVIALDGVELMVDLVNDRLYGEVIPIPKDNDDQHTSEEGSTSESACGCKAGFWGDYSKVCTQCARGTYAHQSTEALEQCPEVELQSRVYIPGADELVSLNLSMARRGDDTSDWTRLHVTVVMMTETPQRDCVYRVRIEMYQNVTENQSTFLSHLGCSVNFNVDGQKYSDCHLEIPYSLTDEFVRWVWLKTSRPPNCPVANVKHVVLRSMSTMFSCPSDNEFWSEDEQQCKSCDEDNAETQGQRCPNGEYEAGCDRLKSMASLSCQPCALPEGLDASEWQQRASWGDGICNLQCHEGYYLSGGLCLPCSASPEIPCSHTAGLRWRGCTSTEDGQCGACDLIQKGIHSRNEFYVADDEKECVTSCKEDFFRSPTGPYECLPCTPIDEMRLVVENFYPQNEYYRFQPCATTSNTAPVRCEEAPNSTILGHADSVGVDCPRSCDLGTHPMLENRIVSSVSPYDDAFLLELATRYVERRTSDHTWRMHSCLVCDPVLSASGAVLDHDAYWVGGDCGFYCNTSHGYHDRRSEAQIQEGIRSCVYCGQDLCDVGYYPAGPDCSECRACMPPYAYSRDGWVFVSSGQVDRNMSCETKCADGMYRDFDVCLKHSILTCESGYFLVNGTETSDVFCTKCRNCHGQRLLTECTSTRDAECEACEAASNTVAREGVEWLGDNCTEACREGWVMNVASGECETCSFECLKGSRTASPRDNCTHCEPCPAIPELAFYTHACSWTCASGYVFKKTSERGRCDALVALDEREGNVTEVAAPVYRCHAGKQLRITSYTSAECVDCTVVTPVENTWEWVAIGSECSWQCLDATPYKYFRHEEHVACLTWSEYEKSISAVPEVPSFLNTWESSSQETSSTQGTRSAQGTMSSSTSVASRTRSEHRSIAMELLFLLFVMICTGIPSIDAIV